jgi:hypothetical protein
VNDYITGVGAALTAAGLAITQTEKTARGKDHAIVVRAAGGVLNLVWNARYGWIIAWLAAGAEHARSFDHLPVDADPGAVVDEVLRVLGGLP